MSSISSDPRAERTRRQIVSALFLLMENQPYNKIKISDITNQGEIARQTFYLHFKSKDEVLVDYIDRIFEDFYQDVAKHFRASSEPDPVIFELLFKQWKRHAQFARLVLEAEVEHLVLKRFQSYISRAVGLYIRSHIQAPKDPEELSYLIDYLAGASWMVVKRWVRSDFSYPQEKLSGLYGNLYRFGVLTALRGEVSAVE